MIEKAKKYRVKVVIDNSFYSGPTTKYRIQKHTIFGWVNCSDETANKNWVYQTCEEMNTPYDDIAKKKS